MDLVRRVARGEEPALEELYRTYEALVYGHAWRLLADESASDEVTVEVFARLWTRAATYDAARGRVASWILAMTRSLALEHLRARRASRHAPLALDGADEPAAPCAGPELRAESSETAARLRRALCALPREQARVMRAAFFGGLTYREVAEALDQPLGTVKTRIRAGLSALRRTLAPEGESA